MKKLFRYINAHLFSTIFIISSLLGIIIASSLVIPNLPNEETFKEYKELVSTIPNDIEIPENITIVIDNEGIKAKNDFWGVTYVTLDNGMSQPLKTEPWGNTVFIFILIAVCVIYIAIILAIIIKGCIKFLQQKKQERKNANSYKTLDIDL